MAKGEPQKVTDEIEFTQIEQEKLLKSPDNGASAPTSGQPVPKPRDPVNRSCTDIICCIVFILFILGLIVVAYFAFAHGDPRLLLYPEDSNKNLCGFGEKKDKPYLYFYDLVACFNLGLGVFVQGCPTTQVCVEKCPDSTRSLMIPGDVCDEMWCNSSSTKSCSDRIKEETCPPYLLESSTVINRCVPDITKILQISTLKNRVGEFFNSTDLIKPIETLKDFLALKEYTDKILNDLSASWKIMTVALVAAMVLSLIWIILMRWIAAPMVWLTLIAFLGLFGFSCYWCFYSYVQIVNGETPDQQYHLYFAVITFDFSQSKFWLALGIICSVTLLIVLLILIFLRKRILIAIDLIREGSKAVGSIMSSLFFPIITFIMQMVVLAIWLILAFYLASTGRGKKTGHFNATMDPNVDMDNLFVDALADCNTTDGTTLGDVCGFLKYGNEKYTFYLQIYNLFMFFWLFNFVIALGQMTLAGAFASYYWAARKPQDIPSVPLLKSFGRCFRYHLGSLAFGSLLIAIVKMIRVFLEWLDQKLKKTENDCARFFLKCLKCCFWCLEKFLQFLNKNAYIMIAIYGKNFCSSAKEAFTLILNNVVRVVVVDKVTDFLLFCGKLVVVGAITAAAYFVFTTDFEFLILKIEKPKLEYRFIPILIVAVGSYIIAACFFSVYGMAVDTLFLCFLEDLEKNDGSVEKPYYMSKNLRKILGKKNKKPEEAPE